jgi:hypothetical protein
MKCHIRVENQPRDDALRRFDITGKKQKIELRMFLDDLPQCSNMHMLEHRLIASFFRQIRAPLNLELVIGAS